MQYEVSIIVLTYNGDLKKLERTLHSILIQKEVTFEIIIADDGSRENHANFFESYFQSYSFSDYKLVMNPVNQGTVKNCLSGLEKAEGEFAKCISPGDYFSDSMILRQWIDFIKERGSEWSFSDAFYYYLQDNNKTITSSKAHPLVVAPYRKQDRKRCIWNYVVLDDIALGAAMITRTALQHRYLQRLADRTVKYAEDNMFRLMMFDGICGEYYPHETIFYEYGSGISSGDNNKWKELLKYDWNLTGQLMMETVEPDLYQRKMIRAMKKKEKGINRFFVKGFINMAIARHLKTRKTKAENLQHKENVEWK